MMNDDFCSYDFSKKLAEKGFDWPCYNFWGLEPDGKPCIITSTLCNVSNSDLKGRDVVAPFLSQAQKWLREEKGIAINVIAHDGGFYQWEEIYLPNAPEYECFIEPDIVQYSTYEQALSVGLSKTIESI